MRTMLAGLAAVVFALGAWIAWERHGYLIRSDPSAKLQREALAGPGIRNVSLSLITEFDWDHVVFFGPYTSQDEVIKALGFDWPGYDDSGIRSTDLYNLIVFAESKRVVRWWKLRRCAPDIDKAFLGVLVSRKDTTLSLRNNGECSYLVGPASMRSNSTPHTDSRASLEIPQPPPVGAGERGR